MLNVSFPETVQEEAGHWQTKEARAGGKDLGPISKKMIAVTVRIY